MRFQKPSCYNRCWVDPSGPYDSDGITGCEFFVPLEYEDGRCTALLLITVILTCVVYRVCVRLMILRCVGVFPVVYVAPANKSS